MSRLIWNETTTPPQSFESNMFMLNLGRGPNKTVPLRIETGGTKTLIGKSGDFLVCKIFIEYTKDGKVNWMELSISNKLFRGKKTQIRDLKDENVEISKLKKDAQKKWDKWLITAQLKNKNSLL
jgi:hypothetical protein